MNDYKEQFIKRTKQHINLVNKYAAKLGLNYADHDSSKLTLLLDNYCVFSKPNPTQEEQAKLDKCTLFHIKNSTHHPEYWTSTDLTGFTRKNFTPNGPIDATKMPDEFIVEMCCDWCACSEEFDNTPFEWFNKVNQTRWIFNQHQQHFILYTLKQIWS